MLMVSTHKQDPAGCHVHAGGATTHAHGKYMQAGRCRPLGPCWESHNSCSWYVHTGRNVRVPVSMLGEQQLMLMVITRRQEGAGSFVHAARATTHAHSKHT